MWIIICSETTQNINYYVMKNKRTKLNHKLTAYSVTMEHG